MKQRFVTEKKSPLWQNNRIEKKNHNNKRNKEEKGTAVHFQNSMCRPPTPTPPQVIFRSTSRENKHLSGRKRHQDTSRVFCFCFLLLHILSTIEVQLHALSPKRDQLHWIFSISSALKGDVSFNFPSFLPQNHSSCKLLFSSSFSAKQTVFDNSKFYFFVTNTSSAYTIT